ncbi:RNA-directed DNA polymerase, eukaryota [Tanacetum coccineum]
MHSNNRISKSIFVTNFPDNLGSKELWKVCEGYGKVIDVFIPNRRSKAGKRFAFVRFIRVNDLDRLVGNLCTIWIGRFHLHANVARFERANKPVKPSGPSQSNAHGTFGSLISAREEDFTIGMPLCSARKVLSKEAVVFRWLWVFDRIGYEIVWVDIEGIPLHVWSRETFAKIGNKWGEVLDIEDNFDSSFAHGPTNGEEQDSLASSISNIKFITEGSILDILDDIVRLIPSIVKEAFRITLKFDFRTVYEPYQTNAPFHNPVIFSDQLEELDRQWIRGTYFHHGFLLVNVVPLRYPFVCGLKQGDPLAPLSFYNSLLWRSLHILFLLRVVDDGLLSKARIGSGVLVLKAQSFFVIWCDGWGVYARKSGLGALVNKHQARLSKWKVPKGVLRLWNLSRRNFFNVLNLRQKDSWKLGTIFPRLLALEWIRRLWWLNKMGAFLLRSQLLSWTCDLSGDGEFNVKVIRNFIDDLFLPSSDVATRWVKFIPIKVNVFSWRARRDRLPTRVNLSRRGVLLDSHLCPLMRFVLPSDCRLLVHYPIGLSFPSQV